MVLNVAFIDLVSSLAELTWEPKAPPVAASAVALVICPWQFALLMREICITLSFPVRYYTDTPPVQNETDEFKLRVNRNYQYFSSVHLFCLCSTYAHDGMKDIFLLPLFLLSLCLPHRILTVVQDVGALFLRMHSSSVFTSGADGLHRNDDLAQDTADYSNDFEHGNPYADGYGPCRLDHTATL